MTAAHRGGKQLLVLCAFSQKRDVLILHVYDVEICTCHNRAAWRVLQGRDSSGPHPGRAAGGCSPGLPLPAAFGPPPSPGSARPAVRTRGTQRRVPCFGTCGLCSRWRSLPSPRPGTPKVPCPTAGGISVSRPQPHSLCRPRQTGRRSPGQKNSVTEPDFAYDVHILFIMKFFALIFICLDSAPKRFLIATPEFLPPQLARPVERRPGDSTGPSLRSPRRADPPVSGISRRFPSGSSGSARKGVSLRFLLGFRPGSQAPLCTSPGEVPWPPPSASVASLLACGVRLGGVLRTAPVSLSEWGGCPHAMAPLQASSAWWVGVYAQQEVITATSQFTCLLTD